LIPNTGPSEASRRHSTGFSPIFPRPCVSETEVVAKELGLEPAELELYGSHKAKIDLSVLDRLQGEPDAKLIGVTAITPTKAGEGKTQSR